MGHSLLSPSSSLRWLNCPGSAELNKKVIQEEKAYSVKGTVAHKLGEIALLEGVFDARSDKVRAKLKKWLLFMNFKEPPEMDDVFFDAVQTYLDYCEELVHPLIKATGVHEHIADTHVEQRVNLCDVSPNTYGSVDFVVYNKYSKVLTVVDYKNGFVSVDAENNTQLMLYAWGAYKYWLNKEANIFRVNVVIVGPLFGGGNLKPVDQWSIPINKLAEFIESAKVKAKQALDPDAPLVSGYWCKKSFCPSMAVCPAKAEELMDSVKSDFAEIVPGNKSILPRPEHLTDVEASKLLILLEDLGPYKKALESYISDKVKTGVDMPFHKLVESKGNKAWTDKKNEEKAIAQLEEMGFSEDEYSEKKLKTVTKILKLAGETGFKGLWERPIKEPKLVQITDKRRALPPSYKEDFAEMQQLPSKSILKKYESLKEPTPIDEW